MHINDITIIDDSKLKKAITAAATGNAMEWFDFGVYGFVAYALGGVFFPGASPGVQMIAALATFSVPFWCVRSAVCSLAPWVTSSVAKRCSRSPLSSWRSAPSVSA